MNVYKLKSILWYKDNASDKIWGYVVNDSGTLFNFWGKREVLDDTGMTSSGKRPSLSFKQHESEDDLKKLEKTKLKKGYVKVTEDDPDTVIPGFSEFIEYALFNAIMQDNYK